MAIDEGSGRTVQLGPVELYVETVGHGPAVVFVHGYTTTSRFWRHQVEHFSRDHLAVSFDLRGHGRSSKSTGVPYTIEAFADDLFLLMEEIGIREAVLAGLSMGGSVALQTALEHASSVRGLILADTTAHGVGAAVDASRVLSRIQQVGVAAASFGIIEASFSAGADRELVEWARSEVSATPRHVAEEAIRSLGAFNVEDRLSEITCPTLVLVGADDHITPPALAKRLADGIAKASLAVVADAAHFPMLEQPRRVTELLESFLTTIG